MKKVNENIRELRRLKGYSQRKFGKMIGKSASQISMYETGRVDIPSTVIYEIADKTGTDIMFLMTGEDNSPGYDAEFRVYKESDREIITPILVANGYDVGQHKKNRTLTGKAVDYYIHITDNQDNTCSY